MAAATTLAELEETQIHSAHLARLPLLLYCNLNIRLLTDGTTVKGQQIYLTIFYFISLTL